MVENKNIIAPQRADILEYKKDMKARPSAIAVILISIKLFLRWLSDEGKYANVADHIKAPKQDKEHKKDYLTNWNIYRYSKQDRPQYTIDGKRNYALTGGLRTIKISRADVAA